MNQQMPSELLPDWIKQEKANQDATRLRAESEAQRQIADSLKIKIEGPVFWQRFLRELEANVRGLAVLHIYGRVASVGRQENEDTYRVEIRLNGLNPKPTYTDFSTPKEAASFAVILCREALINFLFV